MIVSGISPWRSRAQRLTRGHAAEAAGREGREGGGWDRDTSRPGLRVTCVVLVRLVHVTTNGRRFLLPFRLYGERN